MTVDYHEKRREVQEDSPLMQELIEFQNFTNNANLYDMDPSLHSAKMTQQNPDPYQHGSLDLALTANLMNLRIKSRKKRADVNVKSRGKKLIPLATFSQRMNGVFFERIASPHFTPTKTSRSKRSQDSNSPRLPPQWSKDLGELKKVRLPSVELTQRFIKTACPTPAETSLEIISTEKILQFYPKARINSPQAFGN